MDARQPNSAIAKKIGISKQSVQYRINNLMKKGIVEGFYPIINVPKLGYMYCRISISLKDTTEEDEEKMIKELTADKRCFWIFTIQGMYDLLIATWMRTITDLKELIEDILIKYGKFIKDLNDTVTTDVIHYQQRYLIKTKDTREIHIKETKERIEIDELDKKILIKLCDNARYSLMELSQLIGESAKTIGYRIKRMEKLKLIEGYRAIVDHKKLGYTYYKLWMNTTNITKEKLERIKTYLKSQTATIYQVEGVGKPEFLDVEIMVKTNNELLEFVKKLKKEFPYTIGSYRQIMFVDTKKVRYYPF
jgi:DNA-binding Lrp family transcriptional regulator